MEPHAPEEEVQKIEVSSSTQEITPKLYEQLFSDIIKKPSFMDEVAIPDNETLRKKYEQFGTAWDKVVERIDNSDYADKQKVLEGAYSYTFFGSESGETRLMLFGLKPAVMSNWTEDYDRELEQKNPGMPVDLVQPLAVARQHEVFPNIAFTEATYAHEKRGKNYVAFNPDSVGKVIENNSEIFTKLGYDPQKSPTEIAQEVFAKGDPIAMSLVLGFSLESAIVWNLSDVSFGSIGTSEEDIKADQKRRDMYWKSLEAILSEEQVNLLKQLQHDYPTYEGLQRKFEELHVQARINSRRQSFQNPRFKKAWEESGLKTELNTVRKSLLADGPSLEIAKEML